IKEFAVCKQCGLWLSVNVSTYWPYYNSARHNASRTKAINVDPGQFKVTSFLPKKSQVPKHVRKKAHRAAMYMFAKDIQPFSCLLGDGFRHFAQAMIDIGSKYGS
ncbi:transposable element hobo transposase, partial [Biomphalaria glabrata]